MGIFQILILLSIYATYRIVNEIIRGREHLTDKELHEYRYKRNSISSDKARKVTSHLGNCESCKQRFLDLY